jgi:hypothetical protein
MRSCIDAASAARLRLGSRSRLLLHPHRHSHSHAEWAGRLRETSGERVVDGTTTAYPIKSME